MVDQVSDAGNLYDEIVPCASNTRGTGEPFPACSVAYELGREREKGIEITWKSDKKEPGTTGTTATVGVGSAAHG